VYAENAAEGFLPSPGRITHLRAASGPGIRDDSGAYEGWTVPTAYDPLISKVVAWAPDRPGAIARMVRALREYDVRGISTTIGFCRDLVASPAFAAAAFDTTYVDRLLDEHGSQGARSDGLEEIAAIAAAMFWSAREAGPKGSAATDTEVTAVLPTFRPAKQADSLWAQRARLESLR
jgi:acetyl-CoA carboxylase biotin carboxylase subunit